MFISVPLRDEELYENESIPTSRHNRLSIKACPISR